MNKLITYKALLWTSLGALIYCLCFPCWDLFFLSPLVLPSYLFAIHSFKTKREALLLALLAGSIIAVGGFHWVVYVAENFGGLPLIAALLMLAFFCLVAAPQLYVFFYLAFRLRFRVERLPLVIRPLFWSFLYVALEYLFNFFKIFPEYLGNTLIHYLPIAQAASIGGVSLLSFLPLYLGASAYYLAKEKSRAIPSMLASTFLIAGLLFWGKSELKYFAAHKGKTIRVALLQANIGDIDKIVSEKGNKQAIDTVINRYLTLAEGVKGADLIIWPETAYPMAFPSRAPILNSTYAQGYANLVLDRARKIGSSFLFGGYEQEKDRDYNSALLVGADGKSQGSYRKVKLLIFGEWMPFSNIFPKLKELNPQMGDFGKGEGPIPLAWKHGAETTKLGVSICYESIMPDYMRALVRNGADFFVNITNDSWFGPTFEPWQHLQLAELRAIENRRSLVRGTNTGFSVIVNPSGEVTASGPLFQPAVIEGDVEIQNSSSFYLRFGELFAWLSVCVSAIFVGICFRQKD